MIEYSIREYALSDIAAMKQLWCTVFEDSEELVNSFFALLPDMGSAMVAEAEGKIVGAAYVLTGMELLGDGIVRPVCGYIYAVAVKPEYRGVGIGSALVKEAEQLGRRREASVICTLPAEESLYAWYRDLLGFECVLHRKRHEVRSKASEPVMELSSTEYMMWREMMLSGKKHMHPSSPTLEFQRQFSRLLGGGLYSCASGICEAHLDEGVCVINELICTFPEDRDAIAASVAAALGAESAVYYLPSDCGEAYMAALPGTIPGDCIWNLSFD